MTVLNFPPSSSSPYEVNGVTYTWDGAAWVAAGGGDVCVKRAGDQITGAITSLEKEITDAACDLSGGPFFVINSPTTVPTPTNAVAGASGLIRVNAAINGWAAEFTALGELPAPDSFPAIVPFYVESATSVLLGQTSAA